MNKVCLASLLMLGSACLLEAQAPPLSPAVKHAEAAEHEEDGEHGEMDGKSGEHAEVPGAHAEDPHEAFEDSMHDAGDAWKVLSKSSFTPETQPADLKAIENLEFALISAKANVQGVHMSPRAKEQFGGDNVAYLTAMRNALLDTLVSVVELERAVIAGDSAASKAAFNSVNDEQKEGHSIFRRGRDNVGPHDD